MFTMKKLMIVSMVGAMATVSACSTGQVIDNSVSTAGFVTKTAAKGAVGAGKLAVRGVKKVAGSE